MNLYQSPDGAKVLQVTNNVYENYFTATYQSPDGAKVLQAIKLNKAYMAL